MDHDHGSLAHTPKFYERRVRGKTDWICLSECQDYKPAKRRPGHKHVWKWDWNDYGGVHVATGRVEVCIAPCGVTSAEEPAWPTNHGTASYGGDRWCAVCMDWRSASNNACAECGANY